MGDKSTIVVGESQEAAYIPDVVRGRPFLDCRDLGWVGGYTVVGDDVSQEVDFCLCKTAF